ncbi:TraR/DksA family transcriptional regulator [Parafilimonas sp.]|uniref:TraR/DksA family transcriptional regulator n=1 Tax=Parafilimonas sp. TaxID=1969739 RepID=UPI0039E60D85
MPQKKPIKKAAKPAAKKAAAGSKKTAPARKATSKTVKKPVKKVAAKTAKPVAKPKVKKASSKPVVKSSKIIKKAAAPVKKAVAKHESKTSVSRHDKQIKAMSKQKKQEEKPVEKKAVKKPEPIKEVKLPKINAKTSVPYQPSYKSLEQRQEQVKSAEPLVRYSDTELNEFRELIQRKLDAAKKELAYLQGLITRKDDMGGDESENRYMTMEDGSISMEREQLSQMASRQITYIDHLEKALIRIENKTYGICRVTGKLIDKARLRAVPHATLSLEAKLGLVKAGE